MKSKFTAQYLAGLFDADGLLSLHGRKDGYIMCHVSFIMNSVVMLEELQKVFPAAKLYYREPSMNKHGVYTNKQVVEWRLSSKGAKEFVDMIYPHTILKTEDLDWYYRWYDLPRSQGAALSDSIREERVALCEQYKSWRQLSKG